MEQTIAYQVVQGSAYPIRFDHTKPYEQRTTNYGKKTAVLECLAYLRDIEPNMKYRVNRNIIYADNGVEQTKILVIGFVKNRQQIYHAKNRHDFKVPVMLQSECDILEKLESVPNISGYIKSLIRADIKSSKI